MNTPDLTGRKIQRGKLALHLINNRARIYGTHIKEAYVDLGTKESATSLILVFNEQDMYVDLHITTENLDKYIWLLHYVDLQRQLQEDEINYFRNWKVNQKSMRKFSMHTRVTEGTLQIGRVFERCQIQELEVYGEHMGGPLSYEFRIRVSYRAEGQRYVYDPKEGMRSAAIQIG